jgi:hypothetical protein
MSWIGFARLYLIYKDYKDNFQITNYNLETKSIYRFAGGVSLVVSIDFPYTSQSN